VSIAFFLHIQCASLKSHVGIAFRTPTCSVNYGYNVGIAFSLHILCASLKSHVGIAFRASTYNVD
jgi:hypothetical protein